MRLGGFVPVVDNEGVLVGIVTDSDWRRARLELALSSNSKISDVMNTRFVSVQSGMTPREMAQSLLNQTKSLGLRARFPISYVPVLDSEARPIRVLHILELKPFIDELTTQVVVVGLGFVGLTMSLAMAQSGIKVIGVEKNPEAISRIRRGEPNIFEPFVSEIIHKHLNTNFALVHFDELENLVRDSLGEKRIYVLALGTPLNEEKPILDDMLNLVEMLGKLLALGDLVIVRSTVPIGTTRSIFAKKLEKTSGLVAGVDFHLAYCPERTVEGNAIREIGSLPQLISGFSEDCSRSAVAFFSKFVSSTVLMESLEACELAKLASNAYRDVNFAFSNEIAEVALKWGLDINRLISDSNFGYGRNSIAQPSPGVGGPCLSKDAFLLKSSGEQVPLIMEARFANRRALESQSAWLMHHLKGSNLNRVLAVGIAFKGVPATNDLRNSPPLEICLTLLKNGFEVESIDFVATEIELREHGLIPYRERKVFPMESILVLNNHSRNREFVLNILDEIHPLPLLYDPWNLFQDIECFGKVKNRVTMSKVFRY